jgi:hypothetical protein
MLSGAAPEIDLTVRFRKDVMSNEFDKPPFLDWSLTARAALRTAVPPYFSRKLPDNA